MIDRTDVDDRQLKQAFATIFLLTHFELLAQTTPNAKQFQWPLSHLQSAHHRVRQHSDRIRLWTGTSKRLLTWMTLLRTKAEYNSGHAALEHSSSTLSKSTGDPFAQTKSSITAGESPETTRHSDPGVDSNSASNDTEYDTRTAAELAYDTMNQPGFDFFLKSQAFTSRIISLDRYHRDRGTLETEFETLKDGQQINTDLHTLWATRPPTMGFLNDPQALEEAIRPKLAKQILMNIRVYSANFHALFIYLHRVAFKTYPATEDVNTAVSRIIKYARDIVEAATCETGGRNGTAYQNHHLTSSDGLAQPDQSNVTGVREDTDTQLPATMLWPMFLAALECSVLERFWILQTMHEMDLRQVPNTSRTVELLEEVLRRQDSEGKRVDHRSVRQDLFDGEFSVFY